jgi:phosphoesterase RecJ-like protein
LSLKKVIDCIKKYKSFLITSHTNLEGDALGSELALFSLLGRLGKRATIVNEDDIPYEYDFLPGKDNIKKFNKRNLKMTEFDCFVVLDSSDLKRTGQVYRINLEAHKPVLNIDHHISNKKFGNVNWVEKEASCCSEMIYKLYKRLRITIDRDAAVSLYTGILADTGSFRYSNTSGFTHRIASELLKYDISVPEIFKNVYENIPFQDMKLLLRTLPKIRRFARGRVVWFTLTRQMLKNKKLSFDLTENILSFARSIKGVEVGVLFKERFGRKNEIGVNLRSQGKVDVNRIASFFGGGGHRTASGCTIYGNIDAVRKKVLAKIRRYL